jgi:hypothetical protein
MIVNYTGKTIVVNTSDEDVDHSLIVNFEPNDKSLILGDGQQAEFILKKHTYIMTEECSHSGHFPLVLFKHLPKDPIIYVGIKRDETVWLSKDDILASDIDFGLVKMLDQSSPILMVFSPFYMILVFMIVILLVVSIALVIFIVSRKIINYFSG